jgi:hypothetical protein
MSLDVNLWVTKPTQVYNSNITHNLGSMAANVKLSNGLTLYQVLWRPDEHELIFAKDIAELLDEAHIILVGAPEYYMQFNPSNNWGNYDNLCNFVYNYRNICWQEPAAKIGVSR